MKESDTNPMKMENVTIEYFITHCLFRSKMYLFDASLILNKYDIDGKGHRIISYSICYFGNIIRIQISTSLIWIRIPN